MVTKLVLLLDSFYYRNIVRWFPFAESIIETKRIVLVCDNVYAYTLFLNR